MKKKTLVSKVREDLKRSDLEMVFGGIRTITQDAGGSVVVVDGDELNV